MFSNLLPAWTVASRQRSFRTVGLALLTALTAALASAPAVGAENVANVKFKGDPDKKFTHLQAVLDALAETMEKPELWGDNWNQKVPMSGRITNYVLKDMLKDMRSYLTSGDLTIELNPKEATGAATVAAETPLDGNRIILHTHAGCGEDGQALYSDYKLAHTIFHELFHIWQIHKWTALGLRMDKETMPTTMDKILPIKLFDTGDTKDTGGTDPLPLAGAKPTPHPHGKLITYCDVLRGEAEQKKHSGPPKDPGDEEVLSPEKIIYPNWPSPAGSYVDPDDLKKKGETLGAKFKSGLHWEFSYEKKVENLK